MERGTGRSARTASLAVFQHWAYIAHSAETTYAAETANLKATAGTVPSREEHTRSQPRAHNHAQPVTRCDPPLNGSDAKGTDQPTAAATSATASAGPVPAVSPTRLRRNGANATGRNPSNNTAAAALQDVADAAAAAANCQDPLERPRRALC